MELKKFSQIIDSVKASRRISFYRAFKLAIFAGEIRAANIAETFKLSSGKQAREMEDFAVEISADFERWRLATVTRLSSKNRKAPTFDDLKSGRTNFEEAFQATQKRIEQTRKKIAKKQKKIEVPGQATT